MGDMRQEYQDGKAQGITLVRPGLAVGLGDIQTLEASYCAGCGMKLPARSFIDNITGMTWCGGCGDKRNTSRMVLR